MSDVQVTVMDDTETPSLKTSFVSSAYHSGANMFSLEKPTFLALGASQSLPQPSVALPEGRHLSEGAVEDVEAADDSAALLGGKREESDESAPLVTDEIFEVRLFEANEELKDHASKSVYFMAMMKSMRTRSLLHWEVLAAVSTQLFQLVSVLPAPDLIPFSQTLTSRAFGCTQIMLHGFIYAYFVGPSTAHNWNTWAVTWYGIPPEKGGFAVTIASLAALAFSPIVIIFKMEK